MLYYKSIFLGGLLIGIGNSILFDEYDDYKQNYKRKLYKIFITNALGSAITFTGFIYGIHSWNRLIDSENRKLKIDIC